MHIFSKSTLFVCLLLLPTVTNAEDQHSDLNPPIQKLSVAVKQTDELKPATDVRHTRIGYIDIVKIGGESERGKKLKALLTQKKEKIQSKIDQKKKQLEKFEKTITSKLSTMTPQQREGKSKEFRKKVEDFQKTARIAEEEFYTLQEQETKKLYEAIEQSAAAYGKANSFDVIAIKKELLYVDATTVTEDVTDALIKKLNQNFATR